MDEDNLHDELSGQYQTRAGQWPAGCNACNTDIDRDDTAIVLITEDYDGRSAILYCTTDEGTARERAQSGDFLVKGLISGVWELTDDHGAFHLGVNEIIEEF